MLHLRVCLLLLFFVTSWTKANTASIPEAVETDYVFADFQLDNRKTGVELDLATRDYQNYFISLSLFNEQFVAELNCDTDKNLLTGKFWEGEITLPIYEDKQDLFIEDEECYLNISLFEKLDIRMLFDTHRQIFSVLTEGRHPKTKEMKIAARKSMLTKLKDKKENSLEITDHYKLATLPFLDINSNDRWIKGTHRPSLFVQGSLDLFYHQADSQFNWQKGGEIRGRTKFSRKIPWGGNRLHYQMGDIQVSRQSLFDAPSRGLGFSLGERNRTRQRNRMDLSGYTEPFSEVELYKNDLLIDFLPLDENGFYEFKNVDFQDQATDYKIKISSPDGTDSTVKIDRPGEHGLTTGEWTPSLVFLNGSQSLFDNRNNSSGSQLIAADFNYAWSTKELISFGIEHQRKEVNESAFYISTHGFERFGIGFDIKTAYSKDWLYDFSVSKSLGKHSLGYSTNRLSSDSETSSVSHSLNWGFQYEGFSSTFSASQGGNSDNRSRTYSTKLGYKSLQWSIAIDGQRNSIKTTQEQDGSPDFNSEFINNNEKKSFSIVGSANGELGNANASYRRNYGSNAQESFDVSYSKYMLGINTSLSFRWDLEQKTTSTSIKLSKTFEAFRANTNIGYSDSAGWSFGVGISFGLFSHAPLSSITSKSRRKSSNVVMRPFLDTNDNSIWDENERFLPQIALLSRKKRLDQKVSQDKITLYGVDAYDPKTFTVDDTDLDNPFIVPRYKDIKLESHPGGDVSFTIPFQMYYEMEGQVALQDKHGETKERIGQVPLNLHLHTDNGQKFIKTYYTEPDGFYVLDKVKAGQYRLIVDQDFMRKNVVTCQPCELAFDTNDAEDHLLFANTIILTKPAEPSFQADQ